MNQFFEGLANQNNAEVSSTNIKEDFNIRAGGTMTIVKGIVSLEISWWADVYKSNYPGYVYVEDCDYDERDTFINGIKIDSMSKFNEGLTNMGLSSISKNLQISGDEIKNEILKVFRDSKAYKQVYGNFQLFDLLTNEEKREVVLGYAIANYDKVTEWTLRVHGIMEKDSPKPTLEELIKIKSGK
jgi:hypothetical protein